MAMMLHAASAIRILDKAVRKDVAFEST